MSFILKAKKKVAVKTQTRHLLPEMIRRLKARDAQANQLKVLSANVSDIQKRRVGEVYTAPFLQSSLILKNVGNA